MCSSWSYSFKQDNQRSIKPINKLLPVPLISLDQPKHSFVQPAARCRAKLGFAILVHAYVLFLTTESFVPQCYKLTCKLHTIQMTASSHKWIKIAQWPSGSGRCFLLHALTIGKSSKIMYKIFFKTFLENHFLIHF